MVAFPCAGLPDELPRAVLDRATHNQLLLPVHVLPGQPMTSATQNKGHIKRLEWKDSHIIVGIGRQVTCLVKTQRIQGLVVSARTLKTRLMRGVWQILQQNFAL